MQDKDRCKSVHFIPNFVGICRMIGHTLGEGKTNKCRIIMETGYRSVADENQAK